MVSRSPPPDVSDEEIDAVLTCIDETNGYSVRELAAQTELSEQRVQEVLEVLMRRDKITSTPDWEYRKARRRDTDMRR